MLCYLFLEISITCHTARLIGISAFIAIIGISGIIVYLRLKIGLTFILIMYRPTNLQMGFQNNMNQNNIYFDV